MKFGFLWEGRGLLFLVHCSFSGRECCCLGSVCSFPTLYLFIYFWHFTGFIFIGIIRLIRAVCVVCLWETL